MTNSNNNSKKIIWIFSIVGMVIITSVTLIVFLIVSVVRNTQQNLNNELADKPTLTIISGSENKTLEPIIKQFNQDKGYNVVMKYQGSIDILLTLNRNETQEIDAVWPASSLILNLTSNQSLNHSKSMVRMPVILGIKKNKAEQLGWTGNEGITVNQLLDELTQGSLKLAMTNATQSNSGLSGYLAFLYAFSGSPEILQSSDLNNTDVQDKTRALLNAINRSSGSSGWLKDLFLEQYDSLDAMINYEPVIMETNVDLEKQNKTPLQAVYLNDGMVIADSPLAFVDKGQPEKEKIFLELQSYLESNEVKDKLSTLGRRTEVGLGVNTNINNLNSVFRSDWGIRADIPFVTLRYPRKEVIEEMLNLYQISLRKPSFTVYVIDVSGSMNGEGITQLKSAMRTIIDQQSAKQYFLQASTRDVSVVIPFNNQVGSISRFDGNDSRTITDFLLKIEGLQAAGGTDIYSPLIEALHIIQKDGSSGEYFPSVILMTDGRSENANKINQINSSKDIPVFPISFGEADNSQLDAIVKVTGGRVFDGSDNLVLAFREAKGYN